MTVTALYKCTINEGKLSIEKPVWAIPVDEIETVLSDLERRAKNFESWSDVAHGALRACTEIREELGPKAIKDKWFPAFKDENHNT